MPADDDPDYERFEVGFACCKCRQVTTGSYYGVVPWSIYEFAQCRFCGHTRCSIPDRETETANE